MFYFSVNFSKGCWIKKVRVVPIRAVERSLEGPVLHCIIAEESQVFLEATEVVDAIEAMLFNYYVCNIQ